MQVSLLPNNPICASRLLGRIVSGQAAHFLELILRIFARILAQTWESSIHNPGFPGLLEKRRHKIIRLSHNQNIAH
jgi:hypothetical protein